MILDELAAYAKQRVEADKEKQPLEELKELCLQKEKDDNHIIGRVTTEIVTDIQKRGGDLKQLFNSTGRLTKEAAKQGVIMPHLFRDSLMGPEVSLICEIKKASPSKGVISEDFPYLDLAQAYMKGGAAAISCLTEPKWFMGSDEVFKEINAIATIPMLRKDFVVDEYQLYQSKLMGASGVLLIVALHDAKTLESYLKICEELGIDALVEAHDEAEVKTAVSVGAEIIGVNNRNLKDFSVDTSNAAKLRRLVPEDLIYVAESGISSIDDARAAKKIGADAILVGEFLMRSNNPAYTVEKMAKAVS